MDTWGKGKKKIPDGIVKISPYATYRGDPENRAITDVVDFLYNSNNGISGISGGFWRMRASSINLKPTRPGNREIRKSGNRDPNYPTSLLA